MMTGSRPDSAKPRLIPPERLMVETDAPFLLPRDLHHVRGRRNEPAYLAHVAASVARHAGRDLQQLRRSTRQAAFELFRLHARFGHA